MDTIVLSEEQRKMAEDNHNLIYAFCRAHDLSIDEYYDVCAIGLCKAAYYYDPEKARFSTCAYRFMYNEATRHWQRLRGKTQVPQGLIVSADCGEFVKIGDRLIGAESPENDVIYKIQVDNFLTKLNPRERLIYNLRSSGLSQTEAAKRLGVSSQRISKINNQVRRKYDYWV